MAHLENTIAKLLTERLAVNLEEAGITDNGVPFSGLGALFPESYGRMLRTTQGENQFRAAQKIPALKREIVRLRGEEKRLAGREYQGAWVKGQLVRTRSRIRALDRKLKAAQKMKAKPTVTKSEVLKTSQPAIENAAVAIAQSVRAQSQDVKARVATDAKMRLTEVPSGLRRELIPAVKMREQGAWLTRNTAFFTRPELDWTDLRPLTRTAEALPNIHLTEDIAKRGAREAARVLFKGGSPAQAKERLRLLGIKPAKTGRPATTAGERAFPFVWDALPRIAHMAGLGQDINEGAQAFDGYDIVKGAQAFGWLGQDIETGAQAFGRLGQDLDKGAQAFDGYDFEEGAQAFSGVGQAGAEQDPWIEW